MKNKDNTKPCILWAAPFSLHDSSSGAAIQLKCMFEQLVKRGFSIHALSALVFDSPSGASPFANLEKQLEEQKDKISFNLEDSGIKYQYVRTKSRYVKDMTRQEEEHFLALFYLTIAEIKPDAIYLFGTSALEVALMAEAKRHNIKVIFGLHNGNYTQYDFPYADLILTESAATAELYKKEANIDMIPVGSFIGKEKVLVQETKEPKYITLVNPSKEKGISILMRLALMAKKRNPEYAFLVVESRGTWLEAMQIYGQNSQDFPNVSIAKHTTDVRAIYQLTKIILMPSLWYEAFGRISAEATLNGIPVLASTSGGLAEAVNGGGINIPAPAKCKENHSYFPSEEECEIWYTKLVEIVDNYQEWQEKALKASNVHDIEKVTDRAYKAIMSIL